ncbi:MAG: inositol 2-dehydrogenase [Actinobacteria bacterium]|nr:inositol 2-dehydrogenase [Actinomycetota bacterium]
MAKKINVGIIGTGRIGKLHCKNIVYNIPAANVLALSDIQVNEAEKLAGEYNIKNVSENYRDIVNDSDIDAVIICSSTDTHAFIIEEASAAGKHIFCEKPIDLQLGRIDKALKSVEKNKVKLQIGFNRRFDPNFRKAREIIESGKIGRINTLKITSRDPAPPPMDYLKRSGGIFADMTIHDFDMARFLTGNEVEEIYVTGGVLVNKICGDANDLDTAVSVLKFKDGAIGVIENSRSTVYGYDQRVEVLGSNGMINVGNELLDTVELTDSENIKRSLLPHFFLERYSTSFIEEMKEFINCVINNSEPPVTGIDGRFPIVMAMAAKLSYEKNKAVKLKEIT